MDIATAKEVLGKASGWGSFSYVETITKTETNGEKTVTRYELNCHPKKAKREWIGAFGEWIAKMAPWGVIWYIAMKIVEIVANNINAVEKAS